MACICRRAVTVVSTTSRHYFVGAVHVHAVYMQHVFALYTAVVRPEMSRIVRDNARLKTSIENSTYERERIYSDSIGCTVAG